MKAKVLLFKVGEEPTIAECGQFGEMAKLIGADGTDSVTLNIECDNKENEFGMIRAIVDDVGLLIKKPKNRGFYGDFVVVKIDINGFYADLTDGEIERIKDFFTKAWKPHKNKMVEELLSYFHDEIGDDIKMYTFEEDGWSNIVNLSFAELFDDLRRCDADGELSAMLEKVATYHLAGIMSTDDVIEMFDYLRGQLAEMRNKEIKMNWRIS